MIICYSRNFAFIRIPKSGSTSAITMLYDMGILNPRIDICSKIEEGSFSKNYQGDDRLPDDNTSRRAINWRPNWQLIDKRCVDKSIKSFDDFCRPFNRSYYGPQSIHTTWSILLANKYVNNGIKCISTIRHPVDRFISLCYFYNAGTYDNWPGTTRNNILKQEGVNGMWDRFISGEKVFESMHDFFSLHQYQYLSEDPLVWNLENLSDWISKFAEINHVTVKQQLWAKKQNIPRLKDDPNFVTQERQKQIIDWFGKDFTLWENSYKKFN